MAEYVDKEAVKQYLLDRGLYLTDVKNALEINTVADVVKVVRCKDCIYNKIAGCTHSEGYDEQNYNPDYFCADGERDEATGDNTCVSCGTIIPEGRQVCPKCDEERRGYDYD